MENTNFYSFDIFDTCVTRICGEPENIFHLLAVRIGLKGEESKIRAFVLERQKAEKKAERLLKKEAVTIDEIYAVADFSLLTSKDNSSIKEEEEAIEKECIIPIAKTVSLINSLRGKGSIAFISDMYLSSSFLTQILSDLRIYQEGDFVFVSGDIGLTKRSGHLFDHIRQQMNPKCWVHFGDNIYGDYLVPSKKGIKTHRIIHGYSEYENAWLAESRYIHTGKDLSLFAGMTRSVRLGYSSDERLFVTNVMIPMLITFTASVIDDARNKNIDTLYFASRDTYGMFITAQELLKKEQTPKIKYLHISTKVLYPCLISKGIEEEIKEMLSLIGTFKPVKVLEMLGFDEFEIKSVSELYNLDCVISTGDNSADAFIKVILDNYKNKILSNCQRIKELLVKYLKQEGFYGTDSRVALIDIGWRLSSQRAINKLLPDNNIKFYYYGVAKSRLDIRETGDFSSLSYWEDFPDIYGNNKFIEYYICRTNEGSTIGYAEEEGCIIPLLERQINSDAYQEDIASNMTLLRKAAVIYEKLAYAIVNPVRLFDNASMKTLCHFSKYPSKKMLNALVGNFSIGHFSNEDAAIVKLYPWTLVYILSLYIYELVKRKKCSSLNKYKKVWFCASWIYTYGYLGNTVVKYWWKIKESSKLKYFVKCLIFKFRIAVFFIPISTCT